MAKPTAPAAVTIAPLTADRLPDLAALFGTSSTTRGCYCMWFLRPGKEVEAGWGGANQQAFEACARTEAQPMGLIAYVDGEPVGWCATGPRARYTRAQRSPVLRQRDPAEDDSVWLVPCFFVRRDFRRQGIMRELLRQAVDLAAAHGASAIEGFPLAGDARRGSGEAYLGVEPLFAASGFTVVDRPTPHRVVMRLDLSSRDRTVGGSRSRPTRRKSAGRDR
ncbi:MAG: GNAT family N-acetyltransferase [Micromonosporaceae bacterium]|nr:GNAT family N-acetyltransferase [Micromonosporaceae bacterium]